MPARISGCQPRCANTVDTSTSAFDHVRVLDRRPQRHAAAEREPHDRGALVPEGADQRRDVVGHRLEPHRAVDGRRAAVRLEVDPDDLPPGGEQVDVRAEHLDRPEPAVQQDQRLALADDPVAELDPVHVRVLRLRVKSSRPLNASSVGNRTNQSDVPTDETSRRRRTHRSDDDWPAAFRIPERRRSPGRNSPVGGGPVGLSSVHERAGDWMAGAGDGRRYAPLEGGARWSRSSSTCGRRPETTSCSGRCCSPV